MCISKCIERLFGRKKLKNEDEDDDSSKRLRDVEEGNEDWGDWEGSGNWESTSSTLQNAPKNSKPQNAPKNSIPQNAPKNSQPVRSVRKRVKPDYFGEFGMVPTIKKPITKKVVKSQSLRPGTSFYSVSPVTVLRAHSNNI